MQPFRPLPDQRPPALSIIRPEAVVSASQALAPAWRAGSAAGSRAGLSWDAAWVAAYRRRQPLADWWAAGNGQVDHTLETQDRVFRLAQQLVMGGLDRMSHFFHVLRIADRVATEAGQLVGNDASARALVPAYVGFLALNVISGEHRGWLVSGGGTAAMPAVNQVVSGMARDLAADAGSDTGPSGSGLVSHRSGVVVISGDATRALDWLAGQARRLSQTGAITLTPAALLGHVADARSAALAVFRRRGLDPIAIDGRDPAAFAWAIFEIDCRLADVAEAVRLGNDRAPLPFGLAATSWSDGASVQGLAS